MMATLLILAVFVAASAWFALPLMPVFLSVVRPRDLDPLDLHENAARDIRHFAHGFRAFLQATFHDEMADPDGARTRAGRLEEGTEFLVVGVEDTAHFTPEEEVEATTNKLLLFFKPAVLPDRMVFNREVYGSDVLRFGADSVLRAALSDADIVLGENVSLARWLHAVGRVQVGPGCKLMGRVSADEAIVLRDNIAFERLSAPRIDIGVGPDAFPDPEPVVAASAGASFVEVANKRWVVNGDLEMPPGALFKGSLVVRGELVVGEGCRIAGSVKSHGNLILGAGTIVEGAVVSQARIIAGERCRIDGPVIAEDRIEIGAHTRLGRWEAPTTVSAPEVRLATPLQCFGTLWARREGRVVAHAAGSQAAFAELIEQEA